MHRHAVNSDETCARCAAGVLRIGCANVLVTSDDRKPLVAKPSDAGTARFCRARTCTLPVSFPEAVEIASHVQSRAQAEPRVQTIVDELVMCRTTA